MRRLAGAALLTLAVPCAAASPAGYNVLAFWSTACGYCEPVLRQLDQLQHRFGASAVRFYAVGLEPAPALAAVLQRHGLTLPALVASPRLLRRYRIQAIPWVVITDCAGRVIAVPSRQTISAGVPAYTEMELAFRGYPLPAPVSAPDAAPCPQPSGTRAL